MTASNHYRANLRDITFNLFEFLDVAKTTLGKGEFSGMDEATARDMLAQLEKLASNELAASFADSDRTPLVLDRETGDVKLPASLHRSMKAWFDGDWHRLELPERLGGYGAPPSITWAAFEMIVGANPVSTYYQFGTFMARIIDQLGTDAQKKRFVNATIERHWGGTMQLSEPQAGSDVGEGRTKAVQVKDDVFHLTGTKCWITNGDFDFAENIVHLVLARPEGAGPGTKGLSLFIVPKFLVGEDGKIGERNGVVCTHIEKKMGIKASATCVMEFGANKPAVGYLMGNKHDGIRQMFKVIEQARMSVGIKSMSTLSTAYLNSLAYAKERVQGPDLKKIMDKTSPRVRIIEHPDVRRMLMLQKCLAEGMRALVLFTANVQDQVDLQGGHGAKEASNMDQLNDLLLPLIKGYCSEKSFETLATSLQVFGGAGYTQDFPIEQYIRDQKIDTLYEGTTHIQALDLVLRKIMRDGGKTLMGLLGQVQATSVLKVDGDTLTSERESLGKALGQLQGIMGLMLPRAQESMYHIGLHANRILFALSEVVIGWLLIRHAEVAQKKMGAATADDKLFYEGKIAAASFFAKEILPGVALHKKVIENSDLSLMNVAEGAF